MSLVPRSLSLSSLSIVESAGEDKVGVVSGFAAGAFAILCSGEAEEVGRSNCDRGKIRRNL